MFSYTSAIVALLVVAAVAAETPVRVNSKFSQQFQAPQGRVFQPVLLRSLGGQLVLLEQLQSVPQPTNNPLQPQDVAPEVTVKDDDRNITESARNATEAEPETPSGERSEKLTKKEDQGVYYIYHPNGLLQKVVYATNDDVEKMAYSAKLKYENVEPIRDPIYTYDPETFVFKRI